MDKSQLKPGMMVEYHHDAVEVIDIDAYQNTAQVKRCSDNRHFTANCNELYEDPQLHTDCPTYY